MFALQTTYGNVYVAGASDSAPTRLKDIVTIKYDSAGNEMWRRRYRGPLYGDIYSQYRLSI
jgi:hypothetical protein